VASSVDLVFLAAVPLAVLGFLLVLTLKELPLRETPNVGADPSDGAPIERIARDPEPQPQPTRA